MEVQTTIANDIDATEQQSQYDESCRELLADKSVLAIILKECVHEFENVSEDIIKNECIESEPEISKTPVHRNQKTSKIEGASTEDKSLNEGLVRYDIRFFASTPSMHEPIQLIINLEAQNDFHPGYPLIKRAVYYGSRLISAQYGTEFEESHYENIHKVYSIWICMNPTKERENTINEYRFSENPVIGNHYENEGNYDLIDIIMICLGNSDSKNRVIGMLTTLLSDNIDKDTKKKTLEEKYGLKMSKELETEVGIMCNLSQGVLQHGADKANIKNIKNIMASLKCDQNQAMDILQFSEEDREKYLKMLNC